MFEAMLFLGVFLRSMDDIVFAQRAVVMASFDPQIQTSGVVDMAALQFTDRVGVLDPVEADGADQFCRDGRKGLDMVLLFVGAPLAQGLRRSHLFELLDSSSVFGGDCVVVVIVG
jgi:hypothetical protein